MRFHKRVPMDYSRSVWAADYMSTCWFMDATYSQWLFYDEASLWLDENYSFWDMGF